MKIRPYLISVKNDKTIYDDQSFAKRADIIDRLEFDLLPTIDNLLAESSKKARLLVLRKEAQELKALLEVIDLTLFYKLRSEVQASRLTGIRFKELVNAYLPLDCVRHKLGYDNVDIFFNQLISFDNVPSPLLELEEDMIFYQKTPVNVILNFLSHLSFNADDIFFDLGSGLGNTAILIHLLSEVRVVGIEFDPALCGYANSCAHALGLSAVTFINEDARTADYSKGTVFYMFTPFEGEMMDFVLMRLQNESSMRQIKIITYGPCSQLVRFQVWLTSDQQSDDSIIDLAIFTSI